MAYTNKKRISIAVEPELEERLEKLSKRMNMSKTALCSLLISQSINNYETAWEMMGNPQIMSQMLTMFAPNKGKDELEKTVNAIVEKVNEETIK